ncbi:MAG: esterase-like activity of phytase family protein, partial [Kovacikia sp.]
FTATTDIPVGTVIRSIDTSANFTWTKSGSIASPASGSYADLSFAQGTGTTGGDQIAAVQSTGSSPLLSGFTPIFQIDYTGAFEDATSSNTGNVIPGLSQAGNTAVLLGNSATYAAFNFSTLSNLTKEQWLAAVNNPANWTFNNTGTALPIGSITVSSGSATPTVNLSVSSTTGSEAGQTAITVTAIASSAVTGDQTVNLGVAGAGITAADYTLSNTVITIPNGATSGSVTFTVKDDALIEGTEIAGLSLSNPSAGITLGNTTSQGISILDNDGNASLVSTIIVPGNATDLYPTNGGSGGANVNRLGGFGSDFFYDYRTGFYYGLADRGPGGGTISYQTRVEKISLVVDPNTGAASGFQVVQTIPFYIPAGTTLNGVTYTTDTPFNGLNSKQLADGGNGSLLAESQDPEGFVVGANGNFFVSDEYGPSIYEFEPTGKFVRALTPPANVLPKLNGAPYYAGDVSSTTGRQDNRGYEGLAISPDGTKLFAVFQDPLQEEGSGGSNPGRNSRNVRIVRYDVATGQSDAQYIYQLESLTDINDRIPGTANDFSASAQGRNIGISSLVAINNTELLVLERDNRGVGVDPASNLPIGSKRVYKIDLTGATNVSGISLAGTNTLPANVTPVSKSLFLDIAEALQSAGQPIPEKIEGLALGPQLSDGSFALLVATDNDFSVTQNGSGTQFDVYTDGTQQPIDSLPPSSGATLLPSYVYAFRTQPNALDVTPVFDFSTSNYSVTEGNTPGFSPTATVRITRRGDLDNTNTVQLKLSDGTATGGGATPANPLATGPNSSQTPYIEPTATGVSTKSILTVGDSVGGYKMVGIPDGLGAFDNGDGTFTLLMNHELGNTVGVTRAHGSVGAFISKWIINKSDLSVVSGSDLIQTVYLWNGSGFTQGTTVFNRFCSADLADVSAFYNSATGLGTTTRIYLNGEEAGVEGRAFAHIATGANAGTTYQLPYLGKFSWENAVANPFASDKTIVAGMDDGQNGQVYFYVGTKTNIGSEIDKAGLNNGKLFGIKVNGLVDESNTTALATGTRFNLADLGTVQNLTGAQLDAASEAAGITSFLRPEDGTWDPSNPKDFYFTTTNSFTGPSRLWRLRFDDPSNPEAGGTIEMLLDGTEGQKMFDNLTIDRYGHILLQEDIGNQAQIGKIWQYDIATDTLTPIAQHDPARFTPGAANFLTQDEESSGIIDAQNILGPGWFLMDVQAHYANGTELVEGGQLLALFNPDTYRAAVDYNNSPITVTFNPGETFKDVQIPIAGDFIPEGNETVNLSLVNPGVGSVIGTKQPNAVLTITNDDQPPSARIHDIQGAAHRSPLEGQNVTNVPGIVTAVASNGFYLQDPNPDTDIRTSEGIFVFTSSRPTVAVGDYVQVSGRVTEFRPGGSSNNLTTTEITSPTINKLSSGNALPAAIVLGNGGRPIPPSVIENDASNVETSGIFDPAQDGIDFYESLEGMRVQINNPVATSPTNSFGEVWVLADNGANATSKTARGGSLITPTDFNPERIQIDDNLFSGGMPQVSVGAQLGPIVGVVDYNFNNYEVLPTTTPTVVAPSPLTKEITPLVGDANQLTVATFNVENLDPGDGASKFNALASAIVTNLKSPDIISLEEVQDNNGPTNNGVVDASLTYQTLINAIAAAGGPTYQYRQIDPVNNQDGGEPGGNIRVGFLFNPNRVSFVESSLQRLTDPNPAEADSFPGDDFANSRKPLVGTFTFNGQQVTVIGNHFNSKGGDQPLFGPNQPPTLSSENQRNQQATIVKDYVQNILSTNPNANVIVAGDLNDFEFSNPLTILEGAGLKTLIETLPENERYTYNFQGNAQTLDHILTSNHLFNQLNGFDVVHINSEFADQVSDHDPSVARFLFNTAPTALALSATSIDENVPVNTLIGSFTTTDPDPGNTFTYSLVSGAGDRDNSAFTITSNQLKINLSPDFETQSSYSIRVRTTDQGGLSLDKTLTITVNNINEIFGDSGNNTIQGTAGIDTIYGRAGNDKIFGNGGNDILFGEDGNDELYGGAGNDYIDGGNGNDKIYAYGGNNTIYGGTGNDTIVVGAGLNFIDGGAGNDTITLSSGQDTIALARGNGNDTIYNVSAGSTRFNLTAGLTFNDLTITQNGNNTLIGAGSEKLASLVGVQASSITASNFR